MNHMRMVIAGMSGSLMLGTDALTSGKGLSSSPITLRLNSILQEKNEKELWQWCWHGRTKGGGEHVRLMQVATKEDMHKQEACRKSERIVACPCLHKK